MNISEKVKIINNKALCLRTPTTPQFLGKSNDDHDPWIPITRKDFAEFMDKSEEGPLCLLQVLQYLIRQLYCINVNDFKDESGVIKVLPSLDDFVNNDILNKDFENKEDHHLITCKKWDYVVE